LFTLLYNNIFLFFVYLLFFYFLFNFSFFFLNFFKIFFFKIKKKKMDFIYLRKIFNLNNSTKFKIKIKKIEN